MITAENISFRVGSKQILNDVSFVVNPGEMLVILGGNGAGKSTLLRTLSGELKPTIGNNAICGKKISDWKHSELAKFCGVLQQQTTLNLPFSVKDIVMMGRYPHFKHKEFPIDHAIVKNALQKTGIAHLAERNYLSLSGGEQQRVHLARVFAQIWQSGEYKTRYLYMDEPINNLDVRHQHTTLELAKTFAGEGNCVIAVLHDLNLAVQYADKILLLKQGDVVAMGSTKDVLKEEIVSHAYDFPLNIFHYPEYSHPIVMPAMPLVSSN